MQNRELYQVGESYDSIYVNNSTYRAASRAAGCLLSITDEVLSGKVSYTFPDSALCRMFN